MPNQGSVDNHQPGEKWEFNADVASKFDNMLERSIPGYMTMRQLAFDLGRRFVPNHRFNMIDLGASRGESVAAALDSNHFAGAEFYLTEISEPMLDQMRERFTDRTDVHPVSFDLRQSRADIASAISKPATVLGRTGVSRDAAGSAVEPSAAAFATELPTTLVQAILTLIFVPINFRQSIIRGIYEGLAPGGAFIMVEKVLGNSAEMQELLVDAYHEHKNRHGYSWEDIERKRAALEGVQVPVRHEENMAMLRSAGFRNVETFWRHLNFVGYIAIKD